jgi:hypothetical protein
LYGVSSFHCDGYFTEAFCIYFRFHSVGSDHGKVQSLRQDRHLSLLEW